MNGLQASFSGAIVSLQYDDTFSTLWIVSIPQKYGGLVQVNIDKSHSS